jgi:hypothetical protein
VTKEELKTLLETPLDPDLDYFDATASIKAMAEHIRDLHKLINYLFQNSGVQAAAIINIREKIIEHKGAIELVADAIFGEDQTKPKLVGFGEPAIVMPRKPN